MLKKELTHYICDSCMISQMEKQKMGVLFSKKETNCLFFLFCRDLIHQIHNIVILSLRA